MVKISTNGELPIQRIEYKISNVTISYKLKKRISLKKIPKIEKLTFKFINIGIKIIYFVQLKDIDNVKLLWKKFLEVFNDIYKLDDDSDVDRKSYLELKLLIKNINPKNKNYVFKDVYKSIEHFILLCCKKNFIPTYLIESFEVRIDKEYREEKYNNIVVSSFSEYSEIIKEIDKFYSVKWYRGQSQENYKLIPSIFRVNENFTLERKKMKYFLQNAHGYANNCPNDIDYNIWLPFMQHYELHTRLLDWTDSPICALFFALNTAITSRELRKKIIKELDFEIASNSIKEFNPVVYTFYPEEWNGKLHGVPRIPILDLTSVLKISLLCKEAFIKTGYPFELYPIAVTAIRKNSRIISQRGNFTLHGNAFDMYTLRPDLFQKIIILEDEIENILDEMYYMGIDKTTFFPELTALAEVANQRIK